MADRYSGKVALVSGGASGIGHSVVQGLAREGATVVFSDIRAAPGKEAEEAARAQGLDVHFRQSDAVDDASVRDLVAWTTETFGGLNVAINNVGALVEGEPVDMTIEDMSLDIWTRSIHQNLTSCFLGMKYQIGHMKLRGGVIANTASMAGLRVSGATPSYVASKAGVIHLTRYAAVTYATSNIRVNAVAPGMIATPAMIAAFPDEDARKAYISRFQPRGRLIDPEEVAEAFLWLCSDAASGVTGHIVPVDDGWSAT
jgi:NAD(P)-dependent dehydrogenase (short-subunit alcohol dehydrogenase family)